MSKTSKYINLITDGIGYLNRIRDIQPRRGDSFLCCDINAVYGPTGDVSYQRFDLKVSGSDAEHLVRRCQEAVVAGSKVLVGFRIGDLWVDQFTYSRGERAGQTGVSLKGRLLFIRFINIDGQRVYTAESKPRDEVADDNVPVSDAPAPTGTSDTESNSDETTTLPRAASF